MKRAPKDCSFTELFLIRSDHYSTREFWILTESYHVTLTQQKKGEYPKQQIAIPRDDFDKLIAWYLRPQEMRKK